MDQSEMTEDEEDDEAAFSDVVELNVGGSLLTTSVQTLTRCTGSLLASMFSGNADVLPRDRNGRYFIDGDGLVFSHILNFLRNNELPPKDIAVRVYKAAVVLELREFIKVLERAPPVLQYVCRENARTTIPGYRKFISSLFDWMAEECKSSLIGESTFYLSLFKHSETRAKMPKLSVTSQKTHICFATDRHTKQRVTADLYFGPWDSVNEMTEAGLFNFMVSDVIETGYNVVKYGDVSDKCEYRCVEKNVSTDCDRKLFYLTISWWEPPKGKQ